ncbi:adenine phosphoribosyltransferase [Sporothrix brasiliensis 5110]|uniref:adenine phosphoribosyltransferase n=1 Tax=Sporothrix brasiliensis 5110 TaxID=1398154 RepID=A0A0C2ESS4_9PEZI|nr:adenine phosphoribosyltransferase [Sporothrix brasiliensis 5110]KIH89444.1 adenine phosphoribosyltransferase [Sporothrix brasiliensis 5110]
MTSQVPQTAQSQETSPDASRPAATTVSVAQNASGGQSAAAAAATTELASTKIGLYDALRRFVDFPIKGIVFIDIMPIFLDPAVHASLLRALELQALHFSPAVTAAPNTPWVDVVVGLDARGFLFGPGLALRLGAGFAPVRKQGKLPGSCVTASYEKEYGTDYFQIQEDAIKPGQKVLVVDDIIATGGSAAAAGELVRKLGGELVGYMFILEISFLKGREKLGDVPVITLLEEAE